MMIADLNVPHSPSTVNDGPPVSLRLGHLTALEHLVPFTTVRPLRYLSEEGYQDASLLRREATLSVTLRRHLSQGERLLTHEVDFISEKFHWGNTWI